METKKLLSDLHPGQRGIVLSVDNDNIAVRRRLADMGVTPGTEIYIKKTAPFGDPIEVALRGYEMSLRASDAGQIVITKSAPATLKRRRTARGEAPRTAAHGLHTASEYVSRTAPLTQDPGSVVRGGRGTAFALAGNPNAGKTTLFNALTGSNQYVGNWPGVTVEKKEGKAEIQGKAVTIVDLPGIYSLSPYSIEETVALGFITGESPDAVINIVDATNLERNLYLTVQLLELEKPVVMALNFMDEVRKNGDHIDIERLSEQLGIPVIPITAKTGEGLDELMLTVLRQIGTGVTDSRKKLVEAVYREFDRSGGQDGPETLIADARYACIENICASALTRARRAGELSTSDRIDRIVTHKVIAVPIFLAAMLSVFALTFGPLGSWLSGLAASFMDIVIGRGIRAVLNAVGAHGWIVGLCMDGIVSGVGGVLTFLPQIALLFFFLSLLEDSGYMSRAAFIMDRLLKRFGLSGKAFIPMLMGFGCSVPAVMCARTMESEKDRRMTIMLIPFMSCSAKLPVYGLIAAAFFGKYAAGVVFSMYILGMTAAAVSGIIFKNTLFRGDTAPFVLELPPYRMPSLKNTLRHVWEKVRGFLVKAGTLILAMSVLLWFLQSFNSRFQMVNDPAESLLGTIGGSIAPIFRPMGFGTWQAAVALLTGLIAKEAVAAALSMLYGFSLSDSGGVVAAALGDTFASPLAAYAFLVFILLYVPCVAAVSAIRKEMASAKYTLACIVWQLLSAYAASFLVYTIGCIFL